VIPDADGRTQLTKMLTNDALADRLNKIRRDIRWCGKDEREAYLAEASYRLNQQVFASTTEQ
jgi:hypothetical protein